MNEQLNGFEAPLPGGVDLGVSRAQPARSKELVGNIVGDPRSRSDLRLRVVGEVSLLARVGVLDNRPRVAREVSAMNDERADGSAPRGLFELVGPAPVVSQRLAGKKLRIVGRRVTNDDQDDFAFDVDAGVVVPVVLGRGDAVADEDDGGVDVDDRSVPGIVDDVVSAEGEVEAAKPSRRTCSAGSRAIAAGEEGERGLVALDGHAEEINLREVCAVVAAGLEAGESELSGDVGCGEVAAANAGAAAFEEIVGEKADVGADSFGVDGGFGGF